MQAARKLEPTEKPKTQKFSLRTPYMKKLPSEYVKEQVFATFFSDPCGGRMMDWFGEDNFMWSSDYPHAACTWPYSRQIVDRMSQSVDPAVTRKVFRENANRVYQLGLS